MKPWERLAQLKQEIDQLTGGKVVIGKNVNIHPSAVIEGPVVIGDNVTIGVGAYIRPYCIIGNDSTIGHATEIKHCVLGNNVSLPHFNYVGDSVLGNFVHLGGGAAIANFRSDGQSVTVMVGEDKIDTGLRKFGAYVGDHAEIGGGAILNPGSYLEANVTIYAGAIIRGYVPANSIVKVRLQQEIVEKH